jgi:tyrosyl-tRNA synthetase
MVQGGGLMINKQKVTDTESHLDPEDFINGKYLIVQKGKKNYFLITLKN